MKSPAAETPTANASRRRSRVTAGGSPGRRCRGRSAPSRARGGRGARRRTPRARALAPSSPRKFRYAPPVRYGAISSRKPRDQPIACSSSAASSHSDSGCTTKRAPRSASGECSAPIRAIAPPQPTRNSCDGPAGLRVAVRDDRVDERVREVVGLLGGPVVAVAGRVVEHALEVRVGHRAEEVGDRLAEPAQAGERRARRPRPRPPTSRRPRRRAGRCHSRREVGVLGDREARCRRGSARRARRA